MSKPMIVSALAESAVTAGAWLIPGTVFGVKPAVAATASVGLAESRADPALPPFFSDKVGVIKQGLCKVTAVIGTYKFGDSVELDATGQKVAVGATLPVGTVAEDKVLAVAGSLLVYVNVA